MCACLSVWLSMDPPPHLPNKTCFLGSSHNFEQLLFKILFPLFIFVLFLFFIIIIIFFFFFAPKTSFHSPLQNVHFCNFFCIIACHFEYFTDSGQNIFFSPPKKNFMRILHCGWNKARHCASKHSTFLVNKNKNRVSLSRQVVILVKSVRFCIRPRADPGFSFSWGGLVVRFKILVRVG